MNFESCFSTHTQKPLQTNTLMAQPQKDMMSWSTISTSRTLSHNHTMTPFDAPGKQAF